MVHGFKNSKTSSSQIEQGLKNALRKHGAPAVRASAFAFDQAEVLSKGVDALQWTSDKLLEKIRSLKVREVNIPSAVIHLNIENLMPS